MNTLYSNVIIEDGDVAGEVSLTFKDARSFRHWLKAQRKTSFSVTMYVKGSTWARQHVRVSKFALEGLCIDDNEAIIVLLSKDKRGESYSASVELQRIRS